MKISEFKHDDWVKIWDGGWSFLSCTHFGDEYTKEIIFGGKPFKSQSIMFAAKGRSSGWMRQSDRDRLGIYLSSHIKNQADAKQVANRLIQQTKKFLQFIKVNEDTVATLALYQEFWRRLCVYYKAHIHVKYVVDYLQPEKLTTYLPTLQKARLAAETVLDRTEEFLVAFARIISKQTGYNDKLILCLSKSEMEKYLKTGFLPKTSELKQRYNRAAFLHDKKSSAFFAGVDVQKIERLVKQTAKKTEIKGATAYSGKATGTVRIILDPKKAKTFNPGDILVTGATRPEFLPIMHKAAAFVTDAGGILSHAAITAREMKKPCIIGTQIATKILKDGDVVEVDATHGIVKKLR